jgi:hypothetical protein
VKLMMQEGNVSKPFSTCVDILTWPHFEELDAKLWVLLERKRVVLRIDRSIDQGHDSLIPFSESFELEDVKEETTVAILKSPRIDSL